MKAVLARRVEKLEAKTNVQPRVWIWFSKFDMKMLRTPLNVQKFFPDHDFSKPDRETCRKLGQWNIEAVKALKSAKAAGKKDILKIVDTSGELPEFDSCYCEFDPSMTHDDLVKLMDDYSREKTDSNR